MKMAFIASCLLAFTPVAQAAANDVPAVAQVAATNASGDNVSVIVQVGSNNYAETDQTGFQNTAVIDQLGSENYSKVNQSGFGGIVVDTQIGNGNQFTVTQTGPNPPPIIITQHR